jgi:hypothetical protein
VAVEDPEAATRTHEVPRRRRALRWCVAVAMTLCAATFLLEEDWFWGAVWSLGAVLTIVEAAWPARSATPVMRLREASKS